MSTALPAPTEPGTVLAGKYRVERILGQGGMGVVVEARHIALDERVALKFLLPEYAHHPEASARFLREARAAVKIKSEHVAHVSDVGTLEGGTPYMVMEFLDGSDLSKVLEKSGVLPVADAIDYVIQGCDALAEAHGYGIVHRDIKPANLFLGKRPNGLPIVKVLDFGISKMADGAVDNLTKTTAAMGSALYMSPEQMQQTRGVDHRTDVYAMGISLYELLAGRQPFFAESMTQLCAEIFTGTPTSLQSLRPAIPAELARILEKAYARERGDRYQTIAEFVIALAPYAPARSQPMIDSVAKLAGLDAPRAGQVSLPSLPPSGLPRTPNGTQVLPVMQAPASAPVLPGTGGLTRDMTMNTAGPMVSRLSTPNAVPPPKSRTALYAATTAGAITLVGLGLFLGLRSQRVNPPRPEPVAASPASTPASTQPVAAPRASETPLAPEATPAPHPLPSTSAVAPTPHVGRGLHPQPHRPREIPPHIDVVPAIPPQPPPRSQDPAGF